jgi:acyl carrier protein
MTDDEILEALRKILHDSFEIEPGRVAMDTHLFEELDLDSLDAVDLAISLQEMTGKRIKPGDFKSVRTVADVIGAVRLLLAA